MIETLRQIATFNVNGWEEDEFGVFPQGARAKGAYLTPGDVPEAVLRPGWRYLFKQSRKCYPEQFWAEIVAYRIGCLMGIKVPPAFAAIEGSSGACGALIEWFYDEGSDIFIWAGEFLQRMFPDFDREKGTTHTMHGNEILLRAMAVLAKAEDRSFRENWRQWWVDALLFDALIGNTDRHQDNWGFIFRNNPPAITLAPMFDNGTSLGHERHAEQFSKWRARDVDKYIAGGKHQVRWGFEPQKGEQRPFEVVKLALAKWPATRAGAMERLNFSPDAMAQSLVDLAELQLPVPFGRERMDFMLQLLTRRYNELKVILFE
ncbi:MAG: HipA domain-containing protein [Zoogloea sp.]|nr:HipA domain-containing protein [Zoogloea sp.]